MTFSLRKPDDSKYKIMIVEDEEPKLSELTKLLQDSYNIIKAASSQEALQYIQSMEEPNEISAIICDYSMPGFTGIEFLARLNESKLLPNTKSILITGYTNIDIIISAINKGHIYFFVDRNNLDIDRFRLMVKEAVEAYSISNATDIFKNQKKSNS